MRNWLWVLLPFLMVAVSCENEVLYQVKSSIVITPVDRSSASGSVDASQNLVNMGEVAVYSGASAMFKVSNPSQKALNITAVNKTASHGSARYEVVSYPAIVANDLARKEEAYIVIRYIPQEEWTDLNGNGEVDKSELESATFVVESDASNGPVELHITGYGVYKGYPDLQVCYGNYCGPDDVLECRDNGRGLECTASRTLDFGNIGLSKIGRINIGSQYLTLKNVADCPRPDGAEICDVPELCQVTIENNKLRENIGFGFEPGSNPFSRFEISGSTNLPLSLTQPAVTNNGCGSLSEVKILLNYIAPYQVSTDEAVLVIESNDARNPVIRVPIKATAKDAPVAVCNFQTDKTPDITKIAPLGRVYLEGSKSSDPNASEGAVNNGITKYEWQIIKYPDGTNPDDFSPNPANMIGQNFDFWLPLAGKYEVALTVYDKDDTPSGKTDKSICSFEVKPASMLHVQLVWDNPVNDQDLHVLYLDQSRILCDKKYDCYWSNKNPVWFENFAEGEGANPRLDIDDMNGMGPENVNIDDPQPGIYRVFVHYFGAAGNTAETRETVRIFLNGLQAAEYRRTLSSLKDMWAVADIEWGVDANGRSTAKVVPFTGDVIDEFGWLCHDFQCQDNTGCESGL